MRNKSLKLLLALVFFAWPFFLTAVEKKKLLGKKAPSWDAEYFGGLRFTSAQCKGLPLYVHFWETGTAKGIASLGWLKKIGKDSGKSELCVIAINTDPIVQQGQALSLLPADTPGLQVLFDRQGNSVQAFKVGKSPTGFLISKDGYIIERVEDFTFLGTVSTQTLMAKLIQE